MSIINHIQKNALGQVFAIISLITIRSVQNFQETLALYKAKLTQKIKKIHRKLTELYQNYAQKIAHKKILAIIGTLRTPCSHSMYFYSGLQVYRAMPTLSPTSGPVFKSQGWPPLTLPYTKRRQAIFFKISIGSRNVFFSKP